MMIAGFRTLRPSWISALVAGALVAVTAAPIASLADSPTALMSGPNSGSADSFQGPHDWYFLTRPGTFDLQITSTGMGQDSVPLNNAFTYKLLTVPHIGAHAYTYKQDADGFTFHGRVEKATRVTVRIIPAPGNLVRVARNYTIEVTGSAVAFAGAGADPIVGTYMDKSQGHGAAHFNKNGTIAFADGTQGSWVVFDQALRIYTITVGSDRRSVKFVPGRGLLDNAGGGLSLYDSVR